MDTIKKEAIDSLNPPDYTDRQLSRPLGELSYSEERAFAIFKHTLGNIFENATGDFANYHDTALSAIEAEYQFTRAINWNRLETEREKRIAEAKRVIARIEAEKEREAALTETRNRRSAEMGTPLTELKDVSINPIVKHVNINEDELGFL
jgi:hypothetical protein